MNYVDLIIAVFAVAFAVIGYERGLVASALPLAGFVLGAILGGRLGPRSSRRAVSLPMPR